jgi:hypothetical protein
MKIEGTAPTQGPDGRRFSAAKSAPPAEGGKSFGALLKKAAQGKPAPEVPTTAAAPTSAAQTASTPASTPAEAKPAVAGESANAPEAFANHMEMVKLRLKSGYYNNTNVNDALSEKLTGYFDDLA